MNTIEKRTEELLKAHGLDFTIEKLPMVGLRPATLLDANGNPYPGFAQVGTDNFGLYNSKTGEIINVVKDSYRVSQNSEVVELVLRGAEQFGELSVSNAGSLHGGRKVFMQLKVDGYTDVNGDEIIRYVTIIDSNDGSTSLSIGIGDLTMSCQNQFVRFYKAGEAKFRHSATMDKKILEIPRLIEVALGESMRMVELYRAFESNKVSRSLADKMVNHLLGFDKKSTSVRDLSEKSTRSINAMEELYANIAHEMTDKGNNLWGLHSGVTRWTTHTKSAPRREDGSGRIESIMTGTNYKINQQSLDFVLKQADLTI